MIHKLGLDCAPMKTESSATAIGPILVVEDEAALLEMALESLAAHGLAALGVSTAESALERMEQELFPVIVSDIRLPGASGIDLLRETKHRRPETEVVLMTGYASLQSAIQAVNLGACWYIQKPFRPVELALAVRKAAELYHLRAEKEKLIEHQQATLDNLRDSVAWLGNMREQLIQAERKRTFDQTIAALQHELNNRGMGIAAAAGAAKRLMQKGKQDDVLDALSSIEAFVLDISLILSRVARMEQVKTIGYVEGSEIVDLNESP